jgi:hypothetical protein
MMLERGFIVGATRLTKRVWQLMSPTSSCS